MKIELLEKRREIKTDNYEIVRDSFCRAVKLWMDETNVLTDLKHNYILKQAKMFIESKCQFDLEVLCDVVLDVAIEHIEANGKNEKEI